MDSPSQPRTALGAARQRFVDSLAHKGEQLKASVALLSVDGRQPELLDGLRRQLHGLFASAQVFRIEPLASELRRAVELVDAARRDEQGLGERDLAVLRALGDALPDLTEGEVPASLRTAVEAASVQDTTPGEASAPEPEPAPASEPTAAGAPSSEAGTREVEAPSPRPTRPAPAGEAQDTPTVLPPPSNRPREAVPAGGDGEPAAHQVVGVLLLGGLETQVRVQAALGGEGYELLVASTTEDALRLARASAPDVVLAELDRLDDEEVDFLSRLRSDPLTDFVPVVALLGDDRDVDAIALHERGIDDLVALSAPAERLRELLERYARSPLGLGPGPGLGETTVDALAQRLAEEVRRGLADAVARGRDVVVPLGDGAEVVASLWEAVARIREVVAERSGGRIAFHDAPRRGGPSLLTLGAAEVARGALERQVPLRGRRILVADDDPEIVWFFAELLAEEGAETLEARNGEEALVLARTRRPDLILSDILMPGLDGLELARELRRDPALAEVPLILLSWKDDFLQRMRELGAGAADYLRKEASDRHILARIRRALRPLARLEAQLRTGAEVRGRIEGLGVQRLLRTTASLRPDARVVVRDAWNLFEGALRDGALVDLTRTGTDGSFARGEAAAAALVAVTTGRFTVAEAHDPVRPSIRRPLDELLEEANEALASRLEAVCGRNLARVQRLELDEAALQAVAAASPPHVRRILSALSEGHSPRDLLLQGLAAPSELEAVLADLVRRGAVLGVRGQGEEDLVADAQERRSQAPPAALPASEPPGEQVEMEVDGPDEPEDEARTELQSPPPGRGTSAAPEDEDDADDATEVEPATQQVRTRELSLVAEDDSPEDDEDEAATEQVTDPVTEAAVERPSEVTEKLGPTEPGEEAAAGGSLWSWVLLVLVSAALGYAGWKGLEAAGLVGPDRPKATQQSKAKGAPSSEGTAAKQGTTKPGVVAPRGARNAKNAPSKAPAGPREATARGDRVLPRILDAGVAVSGGQALLVVEGPAGAKVRLDGEDIGEAPLRRAVPAGRHELVVDHGGKQAVRSLVFREGTTRILGAR